MSAALEEMTYDEMKELLSDPEWRIRNLYYIMDKHGNKVLFTPNEAQDKFLRTFWHRNVIPKARQRGFSTVVQLMILDACLFVDNTHAAIIAQDLTKAQDICDSKIMFAYNNLPEAIRQHNPLVTENVRRLKWANNSKMSIDVSARGGTLQWLHVSEYGEICAHKPAHAKEIRSGSFPAAEYGVIIVESTAQGLDGGFYDMVMTAKATQETRRKLTRTDFKLHFASWWDADEYEQDPEGVVISPSDHAYFDQKEVEIGRELPLRKRAWYVQKRDVEFAGDREMMWSQYPTTLEEAFQQSTEGTYLADQLSLARREDRIGKYPYNPAYPVLTFWDIGTNDDTAVWFMQQIDGEDHFIDYLECNNEPPSYYVREIQKKPYTYGKHYVPHDAAHKRIGAETLKNYKDMLEELGLRNIEIVPRTPDKLAAIDQLRMDFATYCFDEEKCAEGIKHLANYKKEWNTRYAVWSSTPASNGHQHAADAIRQKAQMAHLLRSSGQKRPRRARRGGMAA